MVRTVSDSLNGCTERKLVGLRLYWPPVWRILIQGVVNATLVMILHVITDQPTEMLFVQRDDMVQDLSPATSHPSFSNSILPGRRSARSLGLQPRCVEKLDLLQTVQVAERAATVVAALLAPCL